MNSGCRSDSGSFMYSRLEGDSYVFLYQDGILLDKSARVDHFDQFDKLW
jgi:hypothetical protein